ncbi:MAG: SF1B family DNA helicase RecD2 [Saccharofermentanales bacterium]
MGILAGRNLIFHGKKPIKPKKSENMQDYENSITINCTVTGIIFQNEKNGYTVCEMQGDNEDFIAVGTLPYIHAGEQLELTGVFCMHPDYGEQFKVKEFIKLSFSTSTAIEKYLSSGILKGIGPKLAKKITAAFGLKTLEIIKNEPARLTEIKGIGLEKAYEYASILNKNENTQSLVIFLTAFDIGQAACLRIEKYFGINALAKIKENPYCLTHNGIGISFHKADQIAFTLGWNKTSILRIQSAMISVLFLALNNGSTYLPLEIVLRETSRLTELQIDQNYPSFELLFNNEQIIFFKESRIVALSLAYTTEKKIADRIINRVRSEIEADSILFIRNDIKEICNKQAMVFDENQIESISQCLCNPLTIITGGPGTGKTTLITILCQYMKTKSRKAVLAAPTGRAAKRMQETTGNEAKTIHRLLELQYRSDVDDYNLVFQRNWDNPIEADMIIIDEASMIDIFLMKHLLEAIPDNCTIVLVGDKNQLPSVGAGNILKDLIGSGEVPVVELTKVYRQEKGSLIIQNSHNILKGLYPVFDQSIKSEFMLISKQNDDERAHTIVSLCKNILKQQYDIDPVREVQILTPTRKSICGTKELNRLLQDALNENNDDLPDKELFAFKRNDKVMQIRNNYETKWISIKDAALSGIGVFNGDMGTVLSIDTNSETFKVLFDDERMIEYSRTNIDELELAYAITVHKSQGSEYPVVVLVLPDAPPILMTRNLLYTAVSRAKEKLFVITEKSILMNMISNTSIAMRNTLLGKLLEKKTIC